jgi:acetyl-CoA carboxylase biotin carboxyl carrier protein
MELGRLKALIDLVSQSKISELEISEGGERIRIVKSASTAAPSSTRANTVARSSSDLPPMSGLPQPPPAVEASAHAVTSPTFGIFHRAQSPASAPYVQLGSQVRAGDTLCLIEAMKSFSAIAADRDGTVSAIFAENGQEVEPGQALIQIEASMERGPPGPPHDS